jgi:hypothetical protein
VQRRWDHDEAVKAYQVIDWLGEGADNYRAMKAMVLQLDPDDDEAERAIRDALERRIEKNCGKASMKWSRRCFRPVMATGETQPRQPTGRINRWRMNDAMEKKLKAALV